MDPNNTDRLRPECRRAPPDLGALVCMHQVPGRRTGYATASVEETEDNLNLGDTSRARAGPYIESSSELDVQFLPHPLGAKDCTQCGPETTIVLTPGAVSANADAQRSGERAEVDTGWYCDWTCRTRGAHLGQTADAPVQGAHGVLHGFSAPLSILFAVSSRKVAEVECSFECRVAELEYGGWRGWHGGGTERARRRRRRVVEERGVRQVYIKLCHHSISRHSGVSHSGVQASFGPLVFGITADRQPRPSVDKEEEQTLVPRYFPLFVEDLTRQLTLLLLFL
ncbi:hypothetical protein QBC39DRAFT_361616 [Podospora conica]|nr:hypothetical protein QBC39DRAFT_361616 [Schizothecium conicum]